MKRVIRMKFKTNKFSLDKTARKEKKIHRVMTKVVHNKEMNNRR